MSEPTTAVRRPKIPYEYLFQLDTSKHPSGVYDGDTFMGKVLVSVDIGFKIEVDLAFPFESIRPWGVNTPEVKGVQREAGLFVEGFVQSEFQGLRYLGIKTIKDKTGKYARPLAHVYYLPGSNDLEEILAEGTHLNQLLLDKGYGLPMDEDGRTFGPGPIFPDTPNLLKPERDHYWKQWVVEQRRLGHMK